MTDQRTVLPGCMMPDGAEPCVAFQRLQAERDRLRAALERLMRGEGGVNSLEQERIAQEALDQEALDHD